MVSWLALIYNFLLLGATVAVLAWVYRRTRLAAVLTYLLYAVVSQFAFVLRTPTEAIIDGNVGQWLGSSPGERIAHYSLLTSTIGHTIQTVLFLWLVLSLVRWSRTNGLPAPAWQGKRRSATVKPEPDVV